MDTLPFNTETNIRDYRHFCIIRFAEQGLTQTAIAEGLACSQGLVSQVLQTYRKEGSSGIQTSTPAGAKPRLKEQELTQLKTYLLQGAQAFGFETKHWTRKRVKLLIEEKFGVHFQSLTSISRLLDKLGFTWKQASFKDPRQDEEEVIQWHTEQLPELQKEAKKEGRTIFYADESSFLLNPTYIRSYWLKNEDFTLESWDKQFNTYGVCGAISPEGKFVYTHQNENFKGEDMVEFLKKLLDKVEEKITLIWDGASIHDCKVVRAFLATLPEGRLKLVRQPAYSPELNASEQVWNYLKNVLLRNKVFKSTEELADELKMALKKMQTKNQTIKCFFKHPQLGFY